MFKQPKSEQRIAAEERQRRTVAERNAYDEGVKYAQKGKAWDTCPYRSQWLRKHFFDGYRTIIKTQEYVQ